METATFAWSDGVLEQRQVPDGPLSKKFTVALEQYMGHVIPEDFTKGVAKIALARFELDGDRYVQVSGPVPDRDKQKKERTFREWWIR